MHKLNLIWAAPLIGLLMGLASIAILFGVTFGWLALYLMHKLELDKTPDSYEETE